MKLTVNKGFVSLTILKEQIEITRKRMEGLWEAKGHTDPGVLDLSIELDDLLNEYQRRIVFKGDLRGERGARGKKERLDIL